MRESIPLRPNEKAKLLTRTGWDSLVANVPLPALWVTAHVDLSLSRPDNAALEQLKMDLKTCQSTDSIANAYRTFLQKIITKLNRKALKSREATRTFRFLGSLERNSLDADGRHLHYHFFLWDPNNSSAQPSPASADIAETLKSLWLQRANDKQSGRYRPIDIEVVHDRENAVRVSGYTNKANPFVTSYELFDDWSTSCHSV